MKQQVPTKLTTREQIMRSRYFALGVDDLRTGRGYPAAYLMWKPNDQWSYERGRAWAVLAPRSVQLKRNGKLNPAAVALYNWDII
jgi:hypothetical protein